LRLTDGERRERWKERVGRKEIRKREGRKKKGPTIRTRPFLFMFRQINLHHIHEHDPSRAAQRTRIKKHQLALPTQIPPPERKTERKEGKGERKLTHPHYSLSSYSNPTPSSSTNWKPTSCPTNSADSDDPRLPNVRCPRSTRLGS